MDFDQKTIETIVWYIYFGCCCVGMFFLDGGDCGGR